MAKSESTIIKRFMGAQDSLVLQSSDLSLETISNMVQSKAIDVSPHYQRRERWKPPAKSALIESFLLNVPVPPVYLAEDDFGAYSVIDGKQRISTIADFLNGKFALSDLTRFTELEGLDFKNLPTPLQNALKIRPYVRAVTLLKQSDPELKYEVFTRLNTGGQPLLPQEIRNALYRGKFNDLLFELSTEAFLRAQLKITGKTESAYQEMLDVELPLRFFTMQSQWRSFSGDYRRSMDAFMSQQKTATQASLNAMKKQFKESLSRCAKIWGGDAFKRYSGGAFRDQFLAAIFDAQMVSVSLLNSKQYEAVLSNRNKILKGTKALYDEDEFSSAVRVSTNTPSKVAFRINRMMKLLSSV